VSTNLGAIHALSWLLCLKEKGRLIFPLGVPAVASDGRIGAYTKAGAFIQAIRHGKRFEASYLGPISFVCDSHLGDINPIEASGLETAFNKCEPEKIIEIRVGKKRKQDEEWFSAFDWGLVISK
jgi:hypothetical protein